MVLSSCHSIYYYRNKTANKAREYALKKMTWLEQTQRDYIRYAPPYFLQRRVFVREGKKYKSKKDVMQTCVIWDVPGMKKSTVVVGVSERRLDDWYPIRLLFKNFTHGNKEKAAATKLARSYVVQKMGYLSVAEQNHVRFSYPLIAFTSFDVDPRRKKLGPKFTQISFIWSSDKDNQKIVVTGFGMKNLHEWKPVTGILRPAEEVDKHRKPEFFNNF